MGGKGDNDVEKEDKIIISAEEIKSLERPYINTTMPINDQIKIKML